MPDSTLPAEVPKESAVEPSPAGNVVKRKRGPVPLLLFLLFLLFAGLILYALVPSIWEMASTGHVTVRGGRPTKLHVLVGGEAWAHFLGLTWMLACPLRALYVSLTRTELNELDLYLWITLPIGWLLWGIGAMLGTFRGVLILGGVCVYGYLLHWLSSRTGRLGALLICTGVIFVAVIVRMIFIAA